MKTKRRYCECICIDSELCICDCECKEHRYNQVPTNEMIEKQKRIMSWLMKKKEKNSLDDEIDKLIFGD